MSLPGRIRGQRARSDMFGAGSLFRAAALLGFLTFVLAGGTALAAVQEEAIERFDSAVEVRADGSMLVTETIAVRSLGREIKRGIYRDFPTIYRDGQGKTVRIPFEVLEVLRDGRPEPFFTKGMSNGVRIYIGDEDVYLNPGRYVYTIVYETDRQIGFFEDHDELYWNVTGNGWAFPIYQARALITLPGSARPTMRDAWVGAQGANDDTPFAKAFSVSDVRGVTVFKTTRPLATGEGLTIAVGFDKGIVAEPSMAAQMGNALSDNAHLFWGLAALVLVVAYYLYAWNRVGRDPKGKTIIPLFQPPDRISPAGCRQIMRMGFDNTCFAAGVLSAAIKGALVVEEPKKREYALKKQAYGPDTDVALLPDEAALVRELFGSSDELVLKQSNHVRVSAVRTALQKALKNRYGAKYFKRNIAWLAPGVLISLAGLAALTLLPQGGEEGVFAAVMTVVVLGWSVVAGSLWTTLGNAWRSMHVIRKAILLVVALGFTMPLLGSGLGLALTLPLSSLGLVAGLAAANLLFFKLMRAYTVKGRQVLDQIEGFKQYLSVAEKHRLELLNPPEETPELFERYLPYALALGVEHRWSERFAGVLAQAQADTGRGWQPHWYHGRDITGLRADRLGARLGAGLAGAVASSSRAPGSSSGFSGGGSSGGGGGGGGGGGW